MKCKKCGMDIIPGSSICPFCGGTELEAKSDTNNVSESTVQMVGNENPDISGVNLVQPNTNVVENTPQPQPMNVDSDVIPTATSNNIDVVNPVQPNTNVVENIPQPQPMNMDSNVIPTAANNNIGGVNPVQPMNMDNHIPPIDTNHSIDGSDSSNHFFQQNKKGIMIIGIIIILLGIGCLIVWGFLKRTPKQIFEQSIDQVFKKVGNTVNDVSHDGYSNIDMKMKANLDSASYNSLEKMLNSISANLTVGMDTKNKKASLELKTNYEGSELFNGNAYLDNQSLYIALPSAYNKTIKQAIGPENYDALFEGTQNSQDTKILLDEISKAMKSSLKKEYFTQEKTTLMVNETQKKVDKSTIKLDFETKQALQKDIINALLASETFTGTYAKVNNQTEAEVKENLQETIDDLKYERNDSSVTEISIYTSGLLHDFVGVTLKQSGTYNKTEMIVTKERKDIYSFILKSGDAETINGKLTMVDAKDKKTIVLTVTIPNFGTCELNLTVSTNENTEIKIPNVQNSISANQMTKTEWSSISEKLLQSEGIQKIAQEIQAFTSPYGIYSY